MSQSILHTLQASIAVKQAIISNSQLVDRITAAINLVNSCFRSGNRLWFCGNGGSAADAQHLAAEFSGRFYYDRPPLPAEALHVNTSYLTAVANDYSYEMVYARLVQGFAQKGDVLIGLSTSGNSPNIVRAFETARNMQVQTIGFTGAGGGLLSSLSDILINVPSNDTPRIQESHITIGHIICEAVEANLFPR